MYARGTDQYVIGSPLFNKITITLENGKQFIINAQNNNSNNVYIQSATLNGKNYTHNWLRYSDIVKGGSLNFKMSDQPAKDRVKSEVDKPFSISKK